MHSAIKDFGDVVCRRDSCGIYTNVPCRIRRHSFGEFNWGYGGSGPAELALNILSVFIGQKAAERGGLYQDFKWEFIAKLPPRGGVIRREDILNWLKK